MFEFQSHLIFPTHAVPGRAAAAGRGSLLSLRPADGHEARRHPHSRRRRRRSETTADPRLRRQCLERPGRRRISARTISRRRRRRLPLSRLCAVDGLAIGRGADRRRAVGLRFRGRAVAARSASSRSASASAAAIAAQLAARRKLDGLILVTPFDSLKAVAQSMYPWLPIGPFFEHEIDAAEASQKSRSPVAIIAARAGRDRPARANRGAAQARPQPRVRPHDRARRAQRHLCAIGLSAAMHEALAAVSRSDAFVCAEGRLHSGPLLAVGHAHPYC